MPRTKVKRRIKPKEPMLTRTQVIAVVILAVVLTFAGTSYYMYRFSRVIAPVTYSGTGTANILAVRGDGSGGEMGHVIVQINPGEGRVLTNTDPFVEPDTQQSMEIAVVAALTYTGQTPAGKDFIISFDTNATLVGGPSAGGAVSVATIAALENKKVRTDMAMTGAIDKDGNILPVGGLVEKITAASEKGVKVVLIPEGEGVITVYEEQQTTSQHGSYEIISIRIVSHEINLIKYAQDNLNVKVEEVGTIAQAASLMLN